MFVVVLVNVSVDPGGKGGYPLVNPDDTDGFVYFIGVDLKRAAIFSATVNANSL